jgi:uncharacterized protein (TIGR00290 family)
MTLVLSWSGGKDSALALDALRRAASPPAALLTVVDEGSGRVAHHGVSRALLEAQAAAAGVGLATVAVPAGAGNAVYEARLRAALDGVDAVAFGDLFLADLRAYREERMAAAGKAARFPLWGEDTRALAERFVAAGFRAVLVSVDGAQVPHELLGREFDAALLDALPPGADPCGENGEFHTFVYDGPVFGAPLAIRRGGRRDDGRFAWLELEPA